VNDVVEQGEEVVRSIYGSVKYERLRALKRAFDPDNVFRLNQTSARTVFIRLPSRVGSQRWREPTWLRQGGSKMADNRKDRRAVHTGNGGHDWEAQDRLLS